MMLSIIVLNYNTGELTCDCVDSVIGSELKFGYEIIIVDNGSTDNSLEIFSKYKKNKLVRIIYNSKNLGFSKGVNTGLKRSKSGYKLILNSDILVKKGSIEKLLDFALKQNDIGVVGPKLINTDGSSQASCLNFPTLKNAIGEYWLGITALYSKYIPVSENPTIVDCVVGAVMLISPRAFNEVGLFDERYFMYYEDIDYCKRVRNNLLNVYYYPKAVFVHYHGKSGENITGNDKQWKRLIPSSKIYHGIFMYNLVNFVLWTGQKFSEFKKTINV